MNRVKARTMQRERGAVAVVLAICFLMLMGAAALGVDIARLVYERQQLRNALDSAAAAGALKLPSDPGGARDDAILIARANEKQPQDPTVTLKCVVNYSSATGEPDWLTAASDCGITSHSFSASDCNTVICSLPCTVTCNTIVVRDSKTVPLVFGPTIGINTGSTGALASAACKGNCGAFAPNPMDVVVVADRTPSMNNYSGAIASMRTGVKSMFATMTQAHQYVALGTIHKTDPAASGCISTSDTGYQTIQTGSWPNKTTVGYKFDGEWIATPFSDDYNLTTRTATGTYNPNTNNPMQKATNCLSVSNYGHTHLASAMKGAARYLLGLDGGTADLNALATRPFPAADIKKVIIFETDGAPYEDYFNSPSSALTLRDNDYDIGDSNGEDACTNFKDIAGKAKDEGILIITIGFGAVNSDRCNGGSSGTRVREALASAASKKLDGSASSSRDCTNPLDMLSENTDGDWYFCGAQGSDLASVFRTAFNQVNQHSRLLALPGVS